MEHFYGIYFGRKGIHVSELPFKYFSNKNIQNASKRPEEKGERKRKF